MMNIYGILHYSNNKNKNRKEHLYNHRNIEYGKKNSNINTRVQFSQQKMNNSQSQNTMEPTY